MIGPVQFERGGETIRRLEREFPTARPHEVAAAVSRAAFGRAFFDSAIFVPHNIIINRMVGAIEQDSPLNESASAAETEYEWVYAVMSSAVSAGVRRPWAYRLLTSSFAADPGIKVRAINKSIENTACFWYSIGGEALQSCLRKYARERELRLATLSYIGACSLIDGSEPNLSTVYENVIKMYHDAPSSREESIVELAAHTIRPRYGDKILRGGAGVFPVLARTGLIPISNTPLNDHSDVIAWPPAV